HSGFSVLYTFYPHFGNPSNHIRNGGESFFEEANELVSLMADGKTPILHPVTIQEARANSSFLQIRIDNYQIASQQQQTQTGPSITGAFINTGALSGDNNCANCGYLKNGLGTNVRSDLGYFNGVEIQFNVSGNLAGHKVVITRTRSTAIIVNGQTHLGSGSDGPADGNMQLNVVNGKVYSVDMLGWASGSANRSAYHSMQMIGNFVETAVIMDQAGNVVSQYSVQWNSSMQLGRSSPDGTFQYLGGSIGPRHVKIP
ncbi:MAG: hypothetical protein KF775_18785, partial [Cyclobacteriaceae bacterium]|nr:hypothetical protein [Cyclobacteriaceae bacterium]